MRYFIFVCALISAAISIVEGHGRLMDPPSRNSMWRSGFSNPANYNDNELNCGGFSYQWSVNNGKCGVCGDPYGREQTHVFPGKYANNIITRTYRKGQAIDVTVEITANHKGYFIFKVGDIGTGAITEEKLTYVLRIARSKNTRYYLPMGSGAGFFMVSLQLPQTLVCKHCVLQWTYVAGNSWGTGKSGSGIGKGAQETFVNCADISIEGNLGPQATAKVTSLSSSAPGTDWRSESVTTVTNIPPTKRTSTSKATPKKHTRMTEVPTTEGKSNCHAVAAYAEVPGMDAWCNANCPEFCPKSHCACSSEPARTVKCRGAGSYAGVPGMDSWCNNNCPVFCPVSHCVCKN